MQSGRLARLAVSTDRKSCWTIYRAALGGPPVGGTTRTAADAGRGSPRRPPDLPTARRLRVIGGGATMLQALAQEVPETAGL